jgi:hypothetical protein
VPREVFGFKGRKQWADGEYFLGTGVFSHSLPYNFRLIK